MDAGLNNNVEALQADIVCIGAGGTGLAAAVAAAENVIMINMCKKHDTCLIKCC
jgi:succinate dehydrogenase/fumarate reductase flavoprotein subunit